ncbi:MAG: hypothetical protein QXR54_00940 [Nanopusillaceae archaeon]
MKIKLVAYDSFSTRSMATLIETDYKIFIDPSISIAPFRYGLPPSEVELEELEKRYNEIIELGEKSDIIIITHYHWDHCPHPENEDHVEILKNKIILAKDFKNTNRSQYFRGKLFYNKIKNLEFCDEKKYEFENTYIEFSKGVFHGEKNSKLGKVVMVYIEHLGDNVLFGSDIQGILTDDVLEFIINKNPKILILSGPPIYHPKWKKELEEKFLKNLAIIEKKTNIEKIILDHHSARSKNYLEYLKYLNEKVKIKILSAADFMNLENRLLEANRNKFY